MHTGNTNHLLMVTFVLMTAAVAGCEDAIPGEVLFVSSSIVDTDQSTCFDDSGEITCPSAGEAFHGQDALYVGAEPLYSDNGDGTVTDEHTGLMWQQDPGGKMGFDDAVAGAASFDLAGHDDWRLPTITELYSLILFSGLDVSGCPDEDSCELVPFIDETVFDFEYGDTGAGERLIDSQMASSTEYVSTTMDGDHTMFGVNFADGRIKGYGTSDPMSGEDKTFFVHHVRGISDYGSNEFVDNGDGTVTDAVAGTMWMQSDSGSGMNWEVALAWCEESEHAGYDDWRLPDAKELQSLVDYSRSPATTDSAAIDPAFEVSTITDEGGGTNYPFFWSSTTHATTMGGESAAYVAFGEALGWMQGPDGSYTLMDVHGAGAQRSDPKTGDASDYPYGHGPQGDVIRIDNHVRCVRDAV
jgi:hypothetical protein